MGAYDNPQIIRDRSGEIYGQALAGIGQSIAQGMIRRGAERKQQRKEADAEQKRVQGIGYAIESKAYQLRNKNYAGLKKTEPALAEQFKEQTESLLIGFGAQGEEGYSMGVIEANTLLATSPNLSLQEKQGLRKIVTDYETFQSSMVGNAGKILTETDIYSKTSPADFDSKYRWAGSNQAERSASQFAAAAFSNQEIPGGRSVKVLDPPGENGENIVTVTTYLDPNDEANRGKYDDEKMYPRNESGEVVLEWKKDLNKWNEGLLEEIAVIPDSNTLFQTAGITDKNGGFTKSQFVGEIEGSLDSISGLKGYSELKTMKIINVASWANPASRVGQILQADIESKAAGFQGMSDSELSSFMQVKMKTGPNWSVDEFRKKSTPDQKKEIQKELNEEYLIQKTSSPTVQKRDKDLTEAEKQFAVIDPVTLLPTIYFEGEDKVVRDPKEGSDGGTSKVIDTSYIDKMDIPIGEGAPEKGGGFIDLTKLSRIIAKKGFNVVKNSTFSDSGRNTYQVTKSVNGADNTVTLYDDMTQKEIKALLKQVETGITGEDKYDLN